MKKLMIAAAIVCAAVVSQGAALKWSLTGVKDHTGTAPSASHSVLCTLYAYKAVSDGQGGYTMGDPVTLTGTYEVTGKSAAVAFNKSTGDDLAKSTPYFAQVVLKDGDWTYDSGAYLTTATPENGDLVLNFTSGAGFAQSGAKVSFTGANYGWQNVPEPTSGLLLLLGVAGLALKRKRA